MMLSIINNNREALLSISGTRLWSGQNAQGYNCTSHLSVLCLFVMLTALCLQRTPSRGARSAHRCSAPDPSTTWCPSRSPSASCSPCPSGSRYVLRPALVARRLLTRCRRVQHKFWPRAGFQNFNTSIIMQYSCYLSVGINTSVNPAMAIGIFSQWWVRTRYPRWFTKYKYVLFAVSAPRMCS